MPSPEDSITFVGDLGYGQDYTLSATSIQYALLKSVEDRSRVPTVALWALLWLYSTTPPLGAVRQEINRPFVPRLNRPSKDYDQRIQCILFCWAPRLRRWPQRNRIATSLPRTSGSSKTELDDIVSSGAHVETEDAKSTSGKQNFALKYSTDNANHAPKRNGAVNNDILQHLFPQQPHHCRSCKRRRPRPSNASCGTCGVQ
jgi:hypothetical protein